MRTCPSCSTRNADDAAFCIGCGASLQNLGWDTTIADAHPPPASRAAGATEPGAVARVAAPPRSLQPVTSAAGGVPHAASFPPAPPSAAGQLAPGTLVDGKYSVERVIGEGGMGIVYLARDVNTDFRVVLKAIRAEFSHAADFRERILAEGRVLARIDHPNVVRLNAVVVERDALYLVMQFIEGHALDQLIRQHVSLGRPIDLGEAMRLYRQILDGVGAAHTEGIIHRDLKPANILVRAKDGMAKVTDFGIAKGEEDARAGRGKTKGIIGSLWYMSPEQLTGQRDLDKRVDVYALGILLFELLIGRVPFDAPSDYEVVKLHLEAPVPKVAALRPEVPPWVDELIAKACAKERAQRFASCEQMRAFVDAHVATPGSHRARPSTTGATSLMPGSVVPSTPGSSRRHLLLAGGALLALACVAGGLYFAGAFGGATTGPTGAPGASASASLPAPESVGGTSARPGVTTAGWSAAGRQDAGTGSTAGGRGSSSLAPLVGRWTSDTNRTYDAVVSGNVLEFRIVDASQYPRQAYRNGEARFTLTALRGQDRAFGVEDHIRPVPPKGIDYDETRARSSCQEVWTTAGAQALHAEFDGSRLTVDLVKLETRTDRFETEGGKVVACRGLKDGAASKIESVLTRSGG